MRGKSAASGSGFPERGSVGKGPPQFSGIRRAIKAVIVAAGMHGCLPRTLVDRIVSRWLSGD
jgi:hypothetical protein